jgi:hypothetical protein
VQEVAVSQDTIVICGDSAVHWKTVENTPMAIDQHQMSLEKLQIPNKDTLIAAMERLTSPELFRQVIDVTSPTSKVCVFSEAFRYHKTRISYFTPQFFTTID